jgi:hypothetical protein
VRARGSPALVTHPLGPESPAFVAHPLGPGSPALVTHSLGPGSPALVIHPLCPGSAATSIQINQCLFEQTHRLKVTVYICIIYRPFKRGEI